MKKPHSIQPTHLSKKDAALGGALDEGVLEGLMRDDALRYVFQPIADLHTGTVWAHEALIRGPKDSIYLRPELLFRLATRKGLAREFDLFCLCQALKQWGQTGATGRLFINISADALVHACEQHGTPGVVDEVRLHGIQPHQLVLEITEEERVRDFAQLLRVGQQLRSTGIQLALDDFGDGRSSLRLWSELRPTYVKIDQYFCHDLTRHSDKLQTLQALQGLAQVFNTQLIAKGIENTADLRLLHDLELPYGQGYLLGKPAVRPTLQLHNHALAVLHERPTTAAPPPPNSPSVTGEPALAPTPGNGHTGSLQVVWAPTVHISTTNNEVYELFLQYPTLHALAVVAGERPLALINREQFMNHYATLYFRELHGRKPCMIFANRAPCLIEQHYNLDELLRVFTSHDQRYLKDGFIITSQGRYVGLGTGDQLGRTLTEVRLEAARHANPLTFLPGNIPINQQIERLLAHHIGFVACYADLNHFKPFNDQYGYWRGDEMIRLVARLCVQHCDPQRDFVGHVGGDDFIILFQSEDWQQRCERIVTEFAQQALALFDEPARLAGGIHGEDRHGVQRFFPCTTLSIGPVVVPPGLYHSAAEVAHAAAQAKHDAKQPHTTTDTPHHPPQSA